jgi:hypothetical protein
MSTHSKPPNKLDYPAHRQRAQALRREYLTNCRKRLWGWVCRALRRLAGPLPLAPPHPNAQFKAIEGA